MTNRYYEARRLAEDVLNQILCSKSQKIFIVFNKIDEFPSIIQKVPFGSKIKEYLGEDDAGEVLEWIKDDIRSKVVDQERRDALVFLPPPPISAHHPSDCKSMFRAILKEMK